MKLRDIYFCLIVAFILSLLMIAYAHAQATEFPQHNIGGNAGALVQGPQGPPGPAGPQGSPGLNGQEASLGSYLGPFQITGNATNGTDVLNNVSVNGAINVKTFGAICDGVTDDTAAFQRAITAAFGTSAGVGSGKFPLYIPATGLGCRVSQLNLTNLNGVRIRGENSRLGGVQSIIKCQEPANNVGVCMDFTGAQDIKIEHVRIYAHDGDNGQHAPKMNVLHAKSTCSSCVTVGNSQDIVYEGVQVENNGGNYAVYNYGGEIWQVSHSNFAVCGGGSGGGLAAIMISRVNTPGISSPFSTVQTNTSMTEVQLRDNLYGIGCNTAVPIMFDGGYIGQVTIDGGFTTGSGGTAFIGDDTNTAQYVNLTVNGIRDEPQNGNSTSTFMKLSSQVQNLEMSGDIFANSVANSVAPLQFNKTGVVSVVGGHINFRPSDAQVNYPSGTVVSCGGGATGVVFDSVDASGGGPLNLSGCKGIAVNYHGDVYDPFAYAGSGANVIPTCDSTYKFVKKHVTDGLTGCTYNSTYAAGAGAATCEVGCDGTNWKYGL